MPRTPQYAALAILIAVSGCAIGRPGSTGGGSADAGPTVALVLEGTALKTAAGRDEAAAAVGAVLGRPIRVVSGEPAVDDVVGAAGRRLGRPFDQTPRAAACRKQHNVATAVANRADVVLRIRLDAKTTTRRATSAERTDLARGPGLTGVLSSVGIGVGDTVHETKLDGTLERTTFPGTTSVRRRIRASDRRLGTAKNAAPPSVRAAIEGAMRALPAATPPRWEPLARGIVTSGCPVLGAAVGDVFVDDTGARRRIRIAAATAVTPTVGKRDEPAPEAPPTEAPPTEAPPTEEVAAAPVEPTPAPDITPAKSDGATTCTNLCSLQMIELCNNDRALWSQHGSRWEDTRCGLRREEAFLADCYRMQWLSGTYERACVQPCEQSDDGRTRLVTMLRRSGCIRAGG